MSICKCVNKTTCLYCGGDLASRLESLQEEMLKKSEKIKELINRNLELSSQLTFDPLVKQTMEIHAEWSASRLESQKEVIELAKKWIAITIEFAEISDPPEITYTCVADLKEVLSKLQDLPE